MDSELGTSSVWLPALTHDRSPQRRQDDAPYAPSDVKMLNVVHGDPVVLVDGASACSFTCDLRRQPS